MKARLFKWFVWGLAIVFVLGFAGTILLMMFVFSIGTAVVTLDVTATALEKGSRRPIPACRLAFEKSEISGYGRTESLTDARGVSRHEVSFSYGGSIFMFWDRDRHPALTMFIGTPPRYDSTDEVEMWVIRLPFDEPYFADRVVPEVSVERRTAFEDVRLADGRLQQAGSREAPGRLTDALTPVEIRFRADAEGRTVYKIPLTIHLDEAQARTCTEGRP